MSRLTKTLTVSLPPQVYRDVENLAKLERKTKSAGCASAGKAAKWSRNWD